MFIYNITYNVDRKIDTEWLNWMLNEHMQQLINTTGFTKFQLLKLHESDEAEGPTYAAQYFIENKDLYKRYMELHALEFENKMFNKWKNSVISFSSLLEIIS